MGSSFQNKDKNNIIIQVFSEVAFMTEFRNDQMEKYRYIVLICLWNFEYWATTTLFIFRYSSRCWAMIEKDKIGDVMPNLSFKTKCEM